MCLMQNHQETQCEQRVHLESTDSFVLETYELNVSAKYLVSKYIQPILDWTL
jgi:hypothetical protein